MTSNSYDCNDCADTGILRVDLVKNAETGERKVLVKLCNHYDEVSEKNLASIAKNSGGLPVEIVR